VAHLVEPEELLENALETARKLAAKPRDALRATKRLMRRPKESLDERVQRENELFLKFLSSPEAREAMAAFLEKRKPDFKQFQG
jgi:enoyl-CoA hydratase/carnithine racemase